MNALFEWAPLFTADNFNEHPGLNERPPQTKKGALIQLVCKNDETRVFFSEILFVFYNKEIYKHIL